MTDLLKKRGRRPRESDKVERMTSVRYKCPYVGCGLEYYSSLGYKRHLMYYKHHLLGSTEKRLTCGYAGCTETEHLADHIVREHPGDSGELMEVYDTMVRIAESAHDLEVPQMEHDIIHDEGLLDISRVLDEEGPVRDIIMETFPKGITNIIDFDTFSEAHPVFYCRIPGCGRQFKSLMAYKYHCGKFTHQFKSLVDDYNARSGANLEYDEVKEAFKKRFNLENRFLLEGVSHHLMRMPDQHYNFIFTFDDAQTGHEKRRTKRKSSDGSSLSEFSLVREKDGKGKKAKNKDKDPSQDSETSDALTEEEYGTANGLGEDKERALHGEKHIKRIIFGDSDGKEKKLRAKKPKSIAGGIPWKESGYDHENGKGLDQIRGRDKDGKKSHAHSSEDESFGSDSENSDKEKDKVLFRVEGVVLNGRKIPQARLHRQGRLDILNLQAEITTLASFGKDMAIVGAKTQPGRTRESSDAESSMKPHNIFSFSSENATLYLLGKDLSIKAEALIEGLGFPRRILTLDSGKVVGLFNGGSLQEITIAPASPSSSSESAYTIRTRAIPTGKEHVVDFTSLRGTLYAASHCALFNVTTGKERIFGSPIVSLSATTEALLLADTNGKVLCVDADLEDAGQIPSKIGTNLVIGLGQTHDLVLMSNSLYGVGRVYSIKAGRAVLVSPYACSNAMLIRPGYILSSSLDGSICISAYNDTPKAYMKVISAEIRSGDFYAFSSDEQHALEEQPRAALSSDFRVCVQGILALGASIVAGFTCGVIVSIDNFLKLDLMKE